MARFKATVEVPLLLASFSFMLTESVYTNLIIYRTCYLILGYNQSECALLGNTYNDVTKRLEKLVEPQAAVINMVKTTANSVVTALLCGFVGAWSDRFGRKPVLLLTQIGFTLFHILMSIYSHFSNLSPWYTPTFSIPAALFGGAAAHFAATLSYITDVTNEETRGFRMAVFEAVLATGTLLGNVSSSYVFYATNYASVSAIAAGCCALGIAFTIFFIPESLESRESQGRLRGLCQVSNVAEMVRAVVKERERLSRPIVLISVGILACYVFTITADGMMFLYLREKLNWTLRKFTLYSSVNNLARIFGTIGGIYLLHNVLDVKESVLVLMGSLCMLNSVLIQGLATRDWHIYLAAAARSLGGVIGPMVRSFVSKLVPVDDIGKIFAFVMALQFLLGIAASPLYTTVYNATISTNPSVFNFMSAGFYAFTTVLIITVIVIENIMPANNYSAINSKNESNENEHTTS